MLENEWVMIAGILVLALLGFKLKALSLSGTFATIGVGILISIGFKGYGLLLIGSFFISSSFWSKYNRKLKEKAEDLHEKGSQRDMVQVLANGGVPAIFSIGYILFPANTWLVGFVTAIAVANSDTWASEIGTLCKKKPISIRNFRQVESGTSGAISALGTWAALFGASFIAVFASVLWGELSIAWVMTIILLGTAGCFVDTILGAAVQAAYRCNACGQIVEKREHCGQSTRLIKGFQFINNDVVNITSILSLAIFAWTLSIIVS